MVTHLARNALLVCCGWAVFAAGCAHGETTNPDLAYVDGFCSAAVQFQNESSVLKPEGAWSAENIEALGKVYNSWADALEEVDPPADIAEFHTVLITQIREAAARLAEATAPDQAIYRLGLLTFPEAAAVRLGVAAEDVEQCNTANFRFDTAIGVI